MASDFYDQQIVSGTQAASSLKLFEGRPVGLVVRTKAQMATAANTGQNYGALFTGTNTTTFITPAMTKGAGNSFYTLNIATGGGGSMTYNMNYLPTKSSGTDPYIRPTAKFLAELIKDSTGTIVGICFTQQ